MPGLSAGMPAPPEPADNAPTKNADVITASDRWSAFLNHLFSAEGMLTVLLILGIVVDSLKQYGNLPPWAVAAIAVLGAVYTIGSKIAVALGWGQQQTILRLKGKLDR